MIHKTVSFQEVIDVLNGALALDREAVEVLVEQRVPCNEALADHPTIQVQGDDSGAAVGLLGVLNGLFGTDEEGWGPIAAVFDDDDGHLIRFEVASRAQLPSDEVEF